MPEDDLEWEEWDSSKGHSFATHMLAGSFAGLAEHVTIFPLDTLRTQVQCERCGSVSPMQTWNCATRIVGKEGIFRLWRGVSAMFAGCIPAHAAYFSIFESMKRATGADKPGHQPIAAGMCGATAALAHDVCMTPFDTIKQRMQLGYYRNMSHCIRSMAAHEGMRSFYTSLPTTLAMNLPFGIIMAAVNESTRRYLARQNPSGQLSLGNSMVAGAIAGAVAAAATTPLDLIKTRLQTQNLEPCPSPASSGGGMVTKFVQNINSAVKGPIIGTGATSGSTRGISSSTVNCAAAPEPNYKTARISSAVQVMQQIWREEGAAGFTRGILPRVMVHAPAVALSWTAYEMAKKFLTERKVFD